MEAKLTMSIPCSKYFLLQSQSNYSFQANQCGISFGCFRQPQGCIDDCQLLITYVVVENMPGYVDFTMTTTAKWIALGHNGVSMMVGKYSKIAKREQ